MSWYLVILRGGKCAQEWFPLTHLSLAHNLSPTHSHLLSLSLSHTHTHTHTHEHSLSHSLRVPDVVTTLKKLSELWVSENLTFSDDDALPAWMSRMVNLKVFLLPQQLFLVSTFVCLKVFFWPQVVFASRSPLASTIGPNSKTLNAAST